MIDKNIVYKPASGEPSVFTEKVNIVNPEWIRHYLILSLGNHIVEGMEQQILINNAIVFVKSKNFKQLKETSAYALAVVRGREIQEKIKKDLTIKGIDRLLTVPESIYVKGTKMISLNWVMHVAREDSMSPEEAYAYGQSLIKE